MTWRELFRRAWLVLRLRFKTFVVCEECGDVKERIEHQSTMGTPYYEWRCESCAEFTRLEGLERARLLRESPPDLRWEDLQALQNLSPSIDPARLQSQIGAPIRMPPQASMIGALGDVIGSAIGTILN